MLKAGYCSNVFIDMISIIYKQQRDVRHYIHHSPLQKSE